MRDLSKITEVNDVYEGCLLGNQPRWSFPYEGSWIAKRLLELMHTDVFRLMTLSLNQNRYFILFIDDYTRMTWSTSCKKNKKFSTHSRNSTKKKASSDNLSLVMLTNKIEYIKKRIGL